MSDALADARDAGYRYFANLLAVRGRKLPREVVGRRVENTFLNLARDLAPTVSLEIGAHEARFSGWLKAEVPTARVVAFEANPHVHQKYAASLADTGIEYLHLAISETDGTVELGIPREFHNEAKGRRYKKPQTNKMASIASHVLAEQVDTVEVPSTPLDTFLSVGGDDVVVAWIDVEGASGAVLSSGAQVLSRASLVYIEVESEPLWEGQWLDDDVARFFADCGLVPVLRDNQRPHQYNVVFANAEIASQPRMARLCNAVYRRAGGGEQTAPKPGS